jgi:putative spermidine/putrescine transport system substrate-binding protein
MRQFGSAVVLAVGLLASTMLSAKELVISTPGGSFLDDIARCKADTFKKAGGTDVTLVANSSTQTAAKLRATKGSPEFDVVYVDSELAVPLAKEGLLEKVDFSSLKSKSDILPQAFDPNGYFVQMMTAATAIAYNPKLIDKPTSWADVLDPKYKGRIALPDITGTSGVQFLLAINKMKGGTLDNLDPGFEAIKAIKDHAVMFYTQADQIVPLFERGDIVMAPWYPDRTGSAADAGVSVAIAYPKEGAVGIRPTIAIPAGTKNKDEALKYIDNDLSEGPQKCFADRKYAGPVNAKVTLSEKAAKILPSAADVEKLWYPDLAVVAAKRPEWTARWQREVTR